MRTDLSNGLTDVFKFILRPLLTMPIRLSSHLIPKDNSLWIFGCYTGNSFDGNSKYFFDYVNKQKSDKKLVVITHSENTLATLQAKRVAVHKAYSLKGLWLVARASKCFITNFVEDDLNILTISNRLKVYNLWHGIPIKSIRWKRPKWIRLILNLVRWQIPKPTIFLSTYNQPALDTPESFHLKQEQIKPFGYPRNDILLGRKPSVTFKGINLNMFNKIWLYAPTFRDTSTSLVPFTPLGLEKISKLLAANNMLLLVSKHPVAKPIIIGKKYHNIVDISSQLEDVQSLLCSVDVLITDYSSICIDYALKGCPIIFYPYDYKEYKKEVGFNFNYFKTLPGPFAQDEIGLIRLMQTIQKWSQTKDYQGKQTAFVSYFHIYKDNMSSQRLYAHVNNTKE